jgi:hypothetical protein
MSRQQSTRTAREAYVKLFFRITAFISLLVGFSHAAENVRRHAADRLKRDRQIPEISPGWHEIPGTRLVDACPDPAPAGNTGCSAIISAWGGAIADTKENRLILWGGGHQDYYGNELYALNLGNNPVTMTRLTNPSSFNQSCTDAQADGNPTSRHTYNGLAYLANKHELYAYSGAKANCGYSDNDTWMFDLATLHWKRLDPMPGEHPIACVGCIADYDTVSQLVYLTDLAALWSYNPARNTYDRLKFLNGLDYHLSGVIDPDDGLFFMIGGPGQLWVIGIRGKSRNRIEDWSGKIQNCGPLLHAPYPGLAYDSVSGLIVGWAGGDIIYVLDPRTKTCAAERYSGGPGPAQPNGTNGRFRYFPTLDSFVLVNDWKQNAFVLRRRR